MIYISPEDDLTSVRERLKEVPSKRVTLIIPAHTQLRSHVAWKLLHACAREMGKEILIVSSDPQIRSVAQAVKFKVANSLAASQSGQVRSGSSRSGRTSSVGKGKPSGASSQRSTPGKEAAEMRGIDSPRLRHQQRLRKASAESSVEQPESKQSGTGEAVAGSMGNMIPPAFRMPEKQYGQAYDFRIDTAPPIRPFPPDQIEEPDLLLEDYHQSQNIRQAASGEIPKQRVQEPAEKTSHADEEISPEDAEDESLLAHRITPLPRIPEDPYEYMQDSQPPPSAEQRAAVPIDSFDLGKPAIRDFSEPPVEIVEGEVEYQGDMGDFVVHSDAPPAARPSSQSRDLRRPGRMGTAGKELKLPPEHRREEDALPPVEDMPTRVMRVSQPLPQSRLRSGPIKPASPAPRQVSSTSAGARSTRSQPIARPGMASTGAVGRARPGSTASRSQKQKAERPKMTIGNAVLIGAIIAVLLLVGFLAYAGPSASIAITLPSRDYFHTVHLTARANGTANPDLAVVPAQTQVKTFTTSGTGTATGTMQVGTVPATGTVFFSNNGPSPIEIPTGSTIATDGANAILFTTTADAVISPSNANPPPAPIPVPIQAQQAGEGGNVTAGSITVIPNDSLNTIAQFNKVPPTNLKLKVVNDKDTSGGGTGTATVVVKQDLDSVKKSLHAQTQGDIDAWLKQLSANGVMGKTSVTDTLINPPAEGQVANNGSFPAVLKVDVAVLYVPNASLQTAALAQLNRFITKDAGYQGYAIIADANHPVRIDGLRQSNGDLTGTTLDFTATARAMPNITADTVRHLVAGTSSINDARTLLASRIPGVQKQNVEIKVSPSFVTWIPARIDVTFIPGSVPPTKQKP